MDYKGLLSSIRGEMEKRAQNSDRTPISSSAISKNILSNMRPDAAAAAGAMHKAYKERAALIKETNEPTKRDIPGPTQSRHARAAYPEPPNPSGADHINSIFHYRMSPKGLGRVLKMHDDYIARATGTAPRPDAKALKWKAYSQMSDAERRKTDKALDKYRQRAWAIEMKNFNAEMDKWRAESRLRNMIRWIQNPDLHPPYGPGDGRWHHNPSLKPHWEFKKFLTYQKYKDYEMNPLLHRAP